MDRCYNAKLSDYDVNNLPADIIYCLCMNPVDENIYENIIGINYEDEFENFIAKQNYSEQEFLRILFSGRLERYKDLIISGIVDLKIEEAAHQKSIIEVEESQAEKDYKRTIIQMLYTTMKANLEENKTLDISITDIRDNKIKASNPNLSIAIEQALSDEFIRLKLNESELTIDEARASITNQEDIDFFLGNEEGDNPNYFLIKDGLITFIPEAVSDEDVEYYAQCHTLQREVSYELVSDVYQGIIINKEPFRKKKGAKVINSALSSFLLRLSFLVRFDNFLSQNEINDIWKYKISNKTCLLIYDFLSLFDGIFRKNVKYEADDKEKKAKYIRALITREMDKNINNYTGIINKINKVWRVKYGLEQFTSKDVVCIEDDEKLLKELDELTEKYNKGEL